MCTRKRYIINPQGKSVLVNCGHCPACKQEKALQRTNRISANLPEDGSYIYLFLTLTYRNECCPYIDLSEASSYPEYVVEDKEGDFVCKEFPVYRDASVRWNTYMGKYDSYLKRDTTRQRIELTTVDVPVAYLSGVSLKPLRHYGSNKIGVCYYRDVQNFEKRLRQYIRRKNNYEKSYSFYFCTEYGPTTTRPHIHGLLACPKRDYKLFKEAIVASWPYDDYRRTRSYIQIAKDASSYVSSYVNCDTSVPQIFKSVRSFRPHHSYSQGFGMALECYSLGKVLQAYERGDLSCSVSRIRNGVLVVDDILLPKYVISRYFPKFKGYCSLNVNEIESVFLRPSTLRHFAARLGYTEEDLHRTQVMLHNKQNFALSHGVPLIDYARAYSHIWTTRFSNVLHNFYDEEIVSSTSNFYAYDNIKSYYMGDVLSPTLDLMMFHVPDNFSYPVDYNRFPRNVAKTNKLESSYYSYSKDRKVRNLAYSQHNNV